MGGVEVVTGERVRRGGSRICRGGLTETGTRVTSTVYFENTTSKESVGSFTRFRHLT